MSEALGAGDRLSGGPSDDLAATAFADELRAAPYLWEGMSHADLAHAIALHQCGAIDTATARALLDALLRLHAVPFSDVSLDARTGDVYNNRDALLRRLAPSVAGHLHAGRARREATTVGWLLGCRDALLGLAVDLADALAVLAALGRAHAETSMPDFTYLHRAHPTTLGHYLLAHAWPLARHLDRVEAVVGRLGSNSPAGSGSVNGTRIPLDRNLLADLLGFSGVMPHTRDAMWAPDVVIDVAGVALQVSTSLDRLAEELQLFTTEGFGFLELADEHSRASVIMPHKKNPYALTHVRGAARRLTGTFQGVVASMHTASGQPDNRTIAYLDVPEMLVSASSSLRLMRSVLVHATFDTDALARAAADPLTASTEVCDELCLRHGLDNRSAHRVVGRAIRSALDDGRAMFTAAELEVAAAEIGVALDGDRLDDDELAVVTDARHVVESRTTPGGAGVGQVLMMADYLTDFAAGARSAALAHPAVRYARRLLEIAAGRDPDASPAAAGPAPAAADGPASDAADPRPAGRDDRTDEASRDDRTHDEPDDGGAP